MVRDGAAVMDIMKARGADLPLPVDVVAPTKVSMLARANRIPVDESARTTASSTSAPRPRPNWPRSSHAGTIVWNGPVGVFEYPQFAGGTKMMASAIAHSEGVLDRRRRRCWPRSPSTTSPTTSATSVPAAAPAFRLEVLEGKTLPAFEVLAKRLSVTGGHPPRR